MFLCWYDPDRKKSADTKLDEAITRYVEKFGSHPWTCITSVQDARNLSEVHNGVAVVGRDDIPRHTFYVGVDDEPVPTAGEG